MCCPSLNSRPKSLPLPVLNELKLSRPDHGLVPADTHGLNHSLGRLDVRSERSMSCKVSLLSQEGPDTRPKASNLERLAVAIIGTYCAVYSADLA